MQQKLVKFEGYDAYNICEETLNLSTKLIDFG